MTDPIRVFDRAAVRRHRERAAPGLAAHDFLIAAAAERLADRLGDVRRAFDEILDLGAHTGQLGRALAAAGWGGRLVAADPALAMARRAGAAAVVADEEALPFRAGAFDAVLSALSLHWVNDLPGALVQARRALRPDGLFLASLVGGASLAELRACLMEAELEVEGGAGPRVSPMIDVRDAGALLQRAGFALPVVDSEILTVTYPDPLALMRELRGMGEANAVAARRRGFSRRETLLRAAALYAERHAGPDGRVPATVEIVTLTGWAPHEAQPRPLRPGSARHSLAEALGTRELPAGDKAPRGG